MDVKMDERHNTKLQKTPDFHQGNRAFFYKVFNYFLAVAFAALGSFLAAFFIVTSYITGVPIMMEA